ncbi:MAG: hypothetical protein ABJA98_08145 [Acidobacteriota bacterium]
MRPGREGLAAGVLALGYGLAGALYWALLNVPESNALALVLSAALVPIILGTAAATTAGAVMIANGATRDVWRTMGAAIGEFVIGLAIFAALWWSTGTADTWWTDHRGEVDALFLRYGGMTRTAWLHQAVFWVTFLARWALGLSIVAGLVVAGARGGGRTLRRGLRGSVRLASLAATLVGVVIVTEGLWRLALWRPKRLPPTWMEPSFVTIKLAVLYALAVAVAAFVLGVHRRGADEPHGPPR